jgi:hypothetical protein
MSNIGRWIRSIVIDAVKVVLIVLAAQGARWAENVLAFYVLGFGGLALLFLLGMLFVDKKSLRDAAPKMHGITGLRLRYDALAGIAFTLLFAGMGWTGMATVYMLGTLLCWSVGRRVEEVLRPTEKATA